MLVCHIIAENTEMIPIHEGRDQNFPQMNYIHIALIENYLKRYAPKGMKARTRIDNSISICAHEVDNFPHTETEKSCQQIVMD